MLCYQHCVCVCVCVFRYGLDMTEEGVMQQLEDYIPAIMEWCSHFMHSEPQLEVGEIEFRRYVHFLSPCMHHS